MTPCFEADLSPANIAKILAKDKRYKDYALPALEKHGMRREWVPCIEEGQTVVDLDIVLDGARATKITIMEGTRIVDRGSGQAFLDKNSRFMQCQPEAEIYEKNMDDYYTSGYFVGYSVTCFSHLSLL